MNIEKTDSIRKITFPENKKLKEFSPSRWGKTDDRVFDELATKVSDDEKVIISDFLNMFYYFIICYSKTCFKKTANWDLYNKSFNEKKAYTFGKVFDYETANILDAHTKLLSIQKKMYDYRNDFGKDTVKDKAQRTRFWLRNQPSDIMEFINYSLRTMCNVISQPVLLISQDIKKKWKNIKVLVVNQN
jgi:hypothetical protein